jgi:hypothetical protein
MKKAKVGGRLKGTPNKFTKFQREFIQNLLDMQLDKIELELNKLSGKPYLDAVFTLIEYTLPKLNKSEINGLIETKNERVYAKLPDGTEFEI